MTHHHTQAHDADRAPAADPPPPVPSLTVEVTVPYLTDFATHGEWYEGDQITGTDADKVFLETIVAMGRAKIVSDDRTVDAAKTKPRKAHRG